MQEMQAQSLGWKDPLKKAMATHSRIPWREEPGGLQFTGSQKSRTQTTTTECTSLRPALASPSDVSTHKLQEQFLVYFFLIFQHVFIVFNRAVVASSYSPLMQPNS